MPESQIKQYYKVAAIITLLVSISFVFLSNMNFIERLWAAFLVNFGYHGFFYFISQVPLLQLNYVKKSQPKLHKIWREVLKTFAMILMVTAVIISIVTLIGVVYEQESESLLALCILVSIFLAGYSLRISLKNFY